MERLVAGLGMVNDSLIRLRHDTYELVSKLAGKIDAVQSQVLQLERHNQPSVSGATGHATNGGGTAAGGRGCPAG